MKKSSTDTGKVSASLSNETAQTLIGKLKAEYQADDNTDSTMLMNLSVDTTEATETTITYEIGMEAVLTYIKDEDEKTTTSNVGEVADFVTVKIELQKGLENVEVRHSNELMKECSSLDELYGKQMPGSGATDAQKAEARKGYFYYQDPYENDSSKAMLYIRTYTFSPFALSYTVPKYVAAIGTKLYQSVADAFSDVKANEVITLIDDAETGSVYTISEPLVLNKNDVVFDLNGKTLTVTGNFSLLISGDNDVVKNGTIQAGANDAKDTKINSYAIVINGCEGAVLEDLVINGGVSFGGSTGETPSPAAATNAVIRDCVVTSGDFYAVCAQQNSTVTIESGNYTADSTSATSGTIQGTFVGTDGPKGTITVTGGVFNGPIVNNDEGDLVLKGGLYSVKPADKYLAGGYIATKDGDYWIIEENFPGSGTEKDPFRIENDDAWMKLVRLCESDSTYAGTAGKYFVIKTDIDASKYTVDACVQYFGGHIDFENHTFSGFDATSGYSGSLFIYVGGESASIENLTLETTKINYADGTVLAFSLCYELYGNVTIKNVNIIGSASGINTNNNGLFATYVGYNDNVGYGNTYNYVFEDCNNYANLTGTKLTAAFIGAGGFANNGSLVFRNCKNYGNIISTGDSASMLNSNCTYFGWGGLTNVVIEGCENLGNIAGTKAQYSTLFTNPNTGDVVFYTQNAVLNGTRLDDGNGNYMGLAAGKEKINTAAGNTLTGSQPANVTAVALGTANNCFVLNATEGATRYELAFSFASANRNGGGAGYTLSFTGDSLPEDIMVGSWITKSEAEASAEEIVEHKEYGTTYYTCGGSYVYYEDGARFHGPNRVINVFFVAYDEQNNVKSIATYTYPVEPNNN